jgi:hypothetical protein
MTKEDIIRMAKQAGLTKGQHWNRHNMTTAFMCDFANLVAAAEREACAKLCLETEPFYGVMFYNAIRARGNT